MTRHKCPVLRICIIVMFMMICAYLTTYWNQFHTDEDPPPIYVFSKDNSNINYNLINYLKSPFPYNPVQNKNKRYSQANQDLVVFELFPKQKGFFIEMGAFDGITFSNTLWLERNHNWTGVLVEANPDLCKVIDGAQRRAWRLCACISEDSNITFIKGGPLGGAADTVDANHLKLLNIDLKLTVPCFKLDQILKYLQRRHIDYFSLDVEGGELTVLNSIKRELKAKTITVDVWTIEYRVIDANQKHIVHKSINSLELIRNYFREVGGYFEHSQVSNTPFVSDGYGLDVIFVNVEAWCSHQTHIPNGNEC